MGGSLRELLKPQLRAVGEGIYNPPCVPVAPHVQVLKPPNKMCPQGTLGLTDAEVVGPYPINVEIHVHRGRHPVIRPIRQKFPVTVMPQSWNQLGVLRKLRYYHAPLTEGRDILLGVKTVTGKMSESATFLP